MDFHRKYNYCIKVGHDWRILDKDGLECNHCGCFKSRPDRIPYGVNECAKQYYAEMYGLNIEEAI